MDEPVLTRSESAWQGLVRFLKAFEVTSGSLQRLNNLGRESFVATFLRDLFDPLIGTNYLLSDTLDRRHVCGANLVLL